MMAVVQFLLSYLLFPGLVFAAIFGLFFEGIDRKIAAHMQNRIGPPLVQPFYDIGKLFAKEDITPDNAQGLFFNGAPLLAFGSVITAMVLIPVSLTFQGFTSLADLIVLIYLLNIPAIALMIGGYASSSPFGIMGSNRYVIQLFGYEFIFIITALTAAFQAGSLNLFEIVSYQSSSGWVLFQAPLAAIGILLAAPGKLLKTPFDIPEAETEIVMGPLTEYSGPKLGLFKLTFNIEILAVAGLITALFLGGPASLMVAGFQIPGVIIFLIKAVSILILITLIRCVTARLRIHQALKFYWLPVAAISLLNLVLVLIGIDVQTVLVSLGVI